MPSWLGLKSKKMSSSDPSHRQKMCRFNDRFAHSFVTLRESIGNRQTISISLPLKYLAPTNISAEEKRIRYDAGIPSSRTQQRRNKIASEEVGRVNAHMPSSVIAAMHYDAGACVLTVIYREKRGKYRYFDVPPSEWEAFRAAPSKGTYLNTVFKEKQYRFERIGETASGARTR